MDSAFVFATEGKQCRAEMLDGLTSWGESASHLRSAHRTRVLDHFINSIGVRLPSLSDRVEEFLTISLGLFWKRSLRKHRTECGIPWCAPVFSLLPDLLESWVIPQPATNATFSVRPHTIQGPPPDLKSVLPRLHCSPIRTSALAPVPGQEMRFRKNPGKSFSSEAKNSTSPVSSAAPARRKCI